MRNLRAEDRSVCWFPAADNRMKERYRNAMGVSTKSQFFSSVQYCVVDTISKPVIADVIIFSQKKLSEML